LIDYKFALLAVWVSNTFKNCSILNRKLQTYLF
jgi:hypothetical protein